MESSSKGENTLALFGIINVNKPKGLTSHDVVSRLRKILNMKQIGHTGTLDPMATGVLPVCIGKATKLIQYLDDKKAYRAYIKLGVKSNTYDLEGEITETNKVKFNFETIKSALSEFQGEITQKPPIYSAVHYKGKRLYEYARKNIDIPDIPERKVFIKDIELIEVLNQESEHPVLVVDIDCSAGTYIRSIANDLGIKLKYGALLENLTRTKAGTFLLDTSFSLEKIQELKQSGQADHFIINPLNVLNLKKYNVDTEIIGKLKNGQYFQPENIDFVDNEKIMLINNNSLISIAEFKDGKIFPNNVFL